MKGHRQVESSSWLPEGARAALCFSIDDVNPSRRADHYDAGGDCDAGVLGLVKWLLERHPRLKLTMFLTADWRMVNPFPTRKILSSIPVLRDRLYLARVLPKGTMRLDRHPEFVAYLKSLPNTEFAVHGLYHCHRGLRTNVEFQEQSREAYREILAEIFAIFERAGISFTRGLCPPNWNTPPDLLEVLCAERFTYMAAARDLFTEISPTATTNMSGLKGVSLVYPQFIAQDRLVHIPANFNATRTIDRAHAIIKVGGIVSIKAHIVKQFPQHTLYDGVDETYMNYLDTLLTVLEDRYGDSLWMASMGEIAARVWNHRAAEAGQG